jgi:hypothetical protein
MKGREMIAVAVENAVVVEEEEVAEVAEGLREWIIEKFCQM